MEEALKVSEERHRTLVENANDAICVLQDGFVKFSNPKAEELFGFSTEELSRTHFIELIHPEDRQMAMERYEKRLRGEEVPSTYSLRVINKGGDELWIQVNVVLIQWEGKNAFLNFSRDITRERRLEVQLNRSQRMEALGTLAGGIAHDFNKLLMAIQGRTSLLLMDKDPLHPDFEHLSGIEEYIKDASNLTRQLLGFARGGKYQVNPIDISELIEMTSSMFGRTKKQIKIHRQYQKGIWAIEADQGQIEQILMNLYVNAWQAMPGGGDLHIKTENTFLNEDLSRSFEVKRGKHVKISITDTGVGMDEVTRQKIFDPFFTTKEMGRGTGLGLASAYGIIKNHEGIINV
ncbi:MAG: PAS domain S-box protein [Thermodesulfobacteriota bacterium]|nr:PAS domain S-box protein [Thermodesulfobacteriota bacterium]